MKFKFLKFIKINFISSIVLVHVLTYPQVKTVILQNESKPGFIYTATILALGFTGSLWVCVKLKNDEVQLDKLSSQLEELKSEYDIDKIKEIVMQSVAKELENTILERQSLNTDALIPQFKGINQHLKNIAISLDYIE